MRIKLFLYFIVSGALFFTRAQIYQPEGLNMPGNWNTWQNPPNNNLYLASQFQVTGGLLTKITTGTTRWTTTFLAGSGGNVPSGTHGFLFTSGSAGNPWSNKWASTTVVIDSLQNYTFQGGSDNTITLDSGKYYTMNWRDAGYTGTQAVFMRTSASPVTISTVTQSPTSVFAGQSVTVTVITAGIKSAEEKFFVRYSTDDFATSTITAVTFTDSTGTATIPALSGTVKYYVLSTVKNTLTANYDMYSLRVNNNSGSNYSYTVQNNFTSSQAGDWNTLSTWSSGAVPPAGAQVTITHDVTVNGTVSNSINKIILATGGSLTFGTSGTLTYTDTLRIAGGTLNMTQGGTLSLANGGVFRVQSGTFTYGTGTVVFNGNGTVLGQVSFFNVNISGGVNFGVYSGSGGSTIFGTFDIKNGGYIQTSPPAYGSGSVLQYSSGGSYGRYLEWSDTAGAGYPFSVRLSNATTLSLSGGDGSAMYRRIAGNLTIDSASVFRMTNSDMTAVLRVNGFVLNNGTLTLSGSVGGDLHVAGNFTNNGTFNDNGRSVQFNGTSVQSIGGTASTSFAYTYINNNSGVNLGRDITVGNTLTLNAGRLFLNNYTLTFDSTAVLAGTPSVSSMVVVNGTGVLRKKVATNGSFTFPVGDTSGTADYSPATLNFTSGTYSSGYVSLSVTNQKYSGITDPSIYLNRYWTVTATGITAFTCNTAFQYAAGDVNGLEDSLYLLRYNTEWQILNRTAVAADSLSGTVSDFGIFTASQQSSVASTLTLNLTAYLQGSYVQISNQQIADTIKVYLRNASGFAIVDSATAVLSASGTASLTFSNANNGTYFIVVTHRNSIETWSKAGGESMVKGAVNTYNFSAVQSNTYGSNVVLVGSKYCIYSGDVNRDKLVDLSDLLMIDNDNANFVSGYTVTDLNGDLIVDLTDLLLADNNNTNFVGAATPLSARRERVISEKTEKLD